MNYLCKVPFVDDMGSISSFQAREGAYETKEEYALWWINTMRDHDGLEHLTELPDGTTFEPLERDS